MVRISESRAEAVAKELLHIRGWKVQRPPKGNLLWKNEYRDYPHLLEALEGTSKTGSGDGYPDFLVVDRANIRPLIVGETKARDREVELAVTEACNPYGEAFADKGFNVLAAGVAGDDQSNIAVQIKKRARRSWLPIEYRREPIQWIPTPEETEILLSDSDLFELQPRIPSNEILAQRGDQMNRILRECKIKDEFRPAIIGAFMLGLWNSKGEIRTDSKHVLGDINGECRAAFNRAGKTDIASSIFVPEANQSLAGKAYRIVHILRLLNITTLTSEHDYLGQLYEMFFRFTGGNTIGQFFTPRHVTKFMADFTEISKQDVVVDPTCGTGGFLVSALQRMTEGKPLTRDQINGVVRDHLIGFESEPITAALCVANMILRGDGTTGVIKGDCFTDKNYPEDKATVVIGNPPFPHKKTDEPAEKFVERGLEALKARGSLAMILPTSVIAKGSKGKTEWRRKILKDNTLQAVITLPNELFQPYASSTTAIIVLRKGVPHSANARTFFCRIENDGLRLKKNVRIEQVGNQLPKALEAWKMGDSIPGFCATVVVPALTTGSEWAPGAYIEYMKHSVATIETEVEQLIQQLSGFQVLHAAELARFDRAVADKRLKALQYGQNHKQRMKTGDIRPNTIGAMFDVYYGQKALHNKENLLPGESLIISSAGTENGCYGFFAYDDLIEAPFVTVPSTGSIGECSVQTRPCGVTDDCLLLIPRKGTDEEELFIAAAIIRLEKWRFDYGRKITPERIKHVKIPREAIIKEKIKNRRRSINKFVSEIIETYTDDFTKR